jgi:aspartyl-tRNA(Asn)/glutamyl-tRNA(Gln) amidotransferase subunit B
MDNRIREKYVVVIGLEVHAQLLTKCKIYASDSTAYGSEPNTQVSAITLAHPGTLPRLNKKAVEMAIKMGLACNSEISRYQIFDRKNYFYPDLPKGYQLTQDRTPICRGGSIVIESDGGEKEIPLHRIHIEEDAGKSIHVEGEPDTLLDFNRAGVPLIEIVTEPALRTAEDAAAVVAEIRKLVRYLDICDGNMEEGSLRCDANVSVMLKGASVFGKKVEVKNMNSIRFVQRAIESETMRQIELLEKGEPVISETRTFDIATGKTYGMRTKEELNDYRYFADPDLSPLIISEQWLNEIKTSMPPLPRQLLAKFISHYKLPAYDARVLTESKVLAEYFEAVCCNTNQYKAASNWVMGPVKTYLNEFGEEAVPVRPESLAGLIDLVSDGTVSYTAAAQKLFPALIGQRNKAPRQLAEELNLIQESDENALQPIVDSVIREFPLKVEEYKKGKKAIVTMFMGEVMKRSKGKADPRVASQMIQKKLNE